MRYIEQRLQLLNADWYFRILPVRGWHEYSENWILLGIALCVSLLLAVIVRNNCYLKDVKGELETMVRTDSLTGILNRKGLFYHLAELYAKGEHFALYYMDLDYFKQINDDYGHVVGDLIVMAFLSFGCVRLIPCEAHVCLDARSEIRNSPSLISTPLTPQCSMEILKEKGPLFCLYVVPGKK